MCQSVVVEYNLSLLIRSGDDISHGTQRGRLHLHLDMRQERDQVWNDATVDDQLDLLVAAVGQVAERPDSVHENVDVRVVNQMTKSWKDLIDGLNWRGWVLVAAQVDDHPSDVAEETDRDVGFHERQQRRYDSHFDDVVSELRAVPDDVSEGPHGLLAHIGSRRKQKSDEQWNSSCIDDLKDAISEILARASSYVSGNAYQVRLLGCSRCNVGERPCSLELEHLVLVAFQASHQNRENATLNQLIDRRITVGRKKSASGLNCLELLLGIAVIASRNYLKCESNESSNKKKSHPSSRSARARSTHQFL